MRVAIVEKQGVVRHSTSWVSPWIEYCQENHIEFDLIDILALDSIEALRKYDVLLWHFNQYNYAEMLEARSLLYCAEKWGGVKVFPGFNDAWHFDDKVAEMYALQSVDAPIPSSRCFYDLNTLKKWIKESAPQFPMVAKLKSGSGSHNVKKIKSESQLLRYAKTMFGDGFNPAPSLIYKTTSNVRSSHDWKTFKAKAKRIPEFLRVLAGAKKFPNEKGYVYLQEFVPNDGFDMKVVVVGDKLSGIYRPIRSHDFRASGGGQFLYNKELFTADIIQSAFETADRLGLKCVGFDYVINKETGKGLIVEMSYGFSHTAVMGAGGYFDRRGVWHEDTFNAPQELLKNILK